MILSGVYVCGLDEDIVDLINDAYVENEVFDNLEQVTTIK